MEIKENKCLPCKLFSAPLFFAFGGYFAFKNRELARSKTIDHFIGR